MGWRLGSVQRHRTVNIEDSISYEGVVPSKRSFLWAALGGYYLKSLISYRYDGIVLFIGDYVVIIQILRYTAVGC